MHVARAIGRIRRCLPFSRAVNTRKTIRPAASQSKPANISAAMRLTTQMYIQTPSFGGSVPAKRTTIRRLVAPSKTSAVSHRWDHDRQRDRASPADCFRLVDTAQTAAAKDSTTTVLEPRRRACRAVLRPDTDVGVPARYKCRVEGRRYCAVLALDLLLIYISTQQRSLTPSWRQKLRGSQVRQLAGPLRAAAGVSAQSMPSTE